MNATELFLERHRPLHDEFVPALLDPLSDDQVRGRPHPEMNPIAWLLWHMARAEDVGVNRLVTGEPQVLDGDGWAERMNVGRRDLGTSMPRGEVTELAGRIDLGGLEAYRRAVARRTTRAVEELEPARLDEPVDRPLVERVLHDEGAGGPDAGWLVADYADQTRGWCLNHFGLTHNYYHLGQAVLLRKLLGVPPPW